jgi:LacI family transcriptional regulator
MGQGNGGITIRDVARAAGVSIGTASRVLNGKQTVSPEIRVRVKQAIEALGYRPNAVAQSMRRRSTQLIGCIIRDITIPSLAAFVRAAHDVLDEAGFSLLISNSEGREERERELLSRLRSQRTAGIMFGPYTPITEEFSSFMRKLEAPVVLVERDEPAWADAVMTDHAGSFRDATRHLLELGHRRILILTGDQRIYPARERLRGYREAHEALGLTIDPTMVRAESFLAVAGYRYTSSLLGGPEVPTAILSGGLDMLAGVLRAVKVRGLRIPADISIVASGDSELAELHTPAIGVARWDQAEVGRTAAGLLLGRIAGSVEAAPQHILLPSEFVARGSIGPPPNRR